MQHNLTRMKINWWRDSAGCTFWFRWYLARWIEWVCISFAKPVILAKVQCHPNVKSEGARAGHVFIFNQVRWNIFHNHHTFLRFRFFAISPIRRCARHMEQEEKWRLCKLGFAQPLNRATFECINAWERVSSQLNESSCVEDKERYVAFKYEHLHLNSYFYSIQSIFFMKLTFLWVVRCVLKAAMKRNSNSETF